MRRYTLASPEAKSSVDLRDYADIITTAVLDALPTASVTVEKDYYTVSPTLTQSQAIKVGRQICQSSLKQYCVQIPKLFSSIEISE